SVSSPSAEASSPFLGTSMEMRSFPPDASSLIL
ncbi:hypothetical protein A2U01_0091718, partial [Trifolium medium]|nr:hypothetical protein [Trifolium medium]